MSEGGTSVLGWGKIVAILIGVALVTGLLFGLMGEFLGLSPRWTNGGLGAAVGIVGAILIGRRRAALDRQKKSRGG